MPPSVLPRFGFVTGHQRPLADGVAMEATWASGVAASGRAVAHLWQGVEGFIVPRSATRAPGWDRACADANVQVRASGGGVVPQGPGLWNLSLLWASGDTGPEVADEVYRALCGELAAALGRLGVRAAPQAVPGSFCDGRYNLAVGGRKIAGTAQAWRRIHGRPVALAHAVLVIDADPDALTARANRLEALLGREARYRADALTSVTRAWSEVHGVAAPPELGDRALAMLAEQFARVLPPHVQPETIDGAA